MTDPHCRIARVRPKDGSAALHIIGGGLSDDGYDDALLAFFASGLREVRERKIVGIAAVIVESSGAVGTGWAGDCPVFLTIGGLSVLQREFMSGNVEGFGEAEGG